MMNLIARALFLCSFAFGAAAGAGYSQDDVEGDLQRVLAEPAAYSVEVLQREHQRYPGSSPVYRLRDGQRPIGILKCNSTAGTDVEGSRITYELSRVLDLPLYTVTVLAPLEFLAELRRTSGGAFDYSKDDCALKEYHVYGTYIWKEQKDQHFYRNLDPAKWALRNALRCDQPLPPDAGDGGSFFIEGDGVAGEPPTPRSYRSPTTLVRAAKDLSSLMLMDAIVGNGDRFIAGENLQFRSQSGHKVHREGDRWAFDEVRFLSIDNGTTFKPSGRPRGLLVHVTRFDREFVARVRDAKTRLETPGPKRDAILRKYPYLGARKIRGRDARKFMVQNMEYVLEHVRAAEARCGGEAFFPGRGVE